ncbi:hypothetical protein MRX96_057637 [Rhipicephalus microplus]
MMNVHGLRRNVKNVNWRHVYKALVLLEYLIKTGSEKVSQQCKENIFAIQTLKDFQHTEDNKDQGLRSRFAQATARVGSEALAKYGSSSRRDSYNSDATSPRGEGDGASGLSSELECARPQTAGEEELQLQLALAMSKEEAEQEERLRKHDDLRLQMAINESQHTTAAMPNGGASSSGAGPSSGADPPSVTDPWGMPLYDGAQAAAPDPWSSPTGSRPVTVGQPSDPWQSPTSKPANHGDPWSTSQDPWRSSAGGPTTNGNDLDEFDTLSKRSAATSPISEQTGVVGDALALGGLRRALPSAEEDELSKRKTPESFLGPNSNLVNLDALVTTRPAGTVGVAPPVAANPFAAPLSAPTTGLVTPGAAAAASNPFQASKPPTINQLRLQNNSFAATPVAPVVPATTTTLLTHPAALVPQQPLAPHGGYVGMPAGATAVGQQNPFL